MPDNTPTQVTPLEGKTSIDDKMFFEPSRLSYQSVDHIAQRITTEVQEAAQNRTVVITGTSLLTDFNNLQAVYLMLESLERDYKALAGHAEVITKWPTPLQHEESNSSKLQSDVTSPATLISGANLNPVTTLLNTALGLASLFREDVDYRGLNTVIDPLTFELALAAKLKAGGANEVFVPDLMVVSLAEATTGSLRDRLKLVQTAKARAWAALGPRIAELILLEAKLDQASLCNDQKLFDKLTAQVSDMRRDLQPVSEHLSRSDQSLAELQNQWNQVSESSGMSQLVRLLRAEAICAMKPLFLHAHVVSSGGHHRLSRNLFRMLFLGDGLSFDGGAIARWALLENSGSVAKGGMLMYRRNSRTRDNLLDHIGSSWNSLEKRKSRDGRLAHTEIDHTSNSKSSSYLEHKQERAFV